jgi:hypothetical protein
VRRGEVLEIRGEDGAPPYLMQITEVARQTKDDAGNASSLSRRQSRGMAEENLRRRGFVASSRSCAKSITTSSSV